MRRKINQTTQRRTAAVGAAATALVVAVTGAGTAAAQPSSSTATAPIGDTCPALYVLGVQGPQETSPGADPNADSGMLGQVFGPMLAASDPTLIRRVYIAYSQPPAETATPTTGVTGTPHEPGTTGSAVESAVTATLGEVTDTAADVLTACPDTLLAAAGYAEGARVVSRFANMVAAGRGGTRIPTDKIAGIALFADPDRTPAAPVLPGRPDLTSPLAPPPLSGHHRHSTEITLSNPRPSGGGVTATRDTTATGTGTGAGTGTGNDYGPLAGRVVNFCAPGDLTCDAPANGALLQVVHNIATRANLTDPLAAIGAIAQGLASTVFNTTVSVFNNDITGTRAPTLDYRPQQTISQRLADASDPTRSQPGVADAITALLRVGMIGIDATTTIAKTVLTPDTIAALIAAGVTNPAAAATLSAKLATAAVQLVPPDAPTRLTRIAFDTISELVSDNRDLFDLSVLSKYSDTIGRRQAYDTSPAAPDGTPATAVTANWFTALARDLAEAGHHGGQPSRTTASTPSSTGTSTSTTTTGAPSSSTATATRSTPTPTPAPTSRAPSP